jgi:5-hydroxybenzimidazole methyltransferase
VKYPPFYGSDPQASGAQYLEDLSTAYWFSEVLFAGVETGIFTFLEREGKSIEEIGSALDFRRTGLERFLNSLCGIGLLIRDGSRYFNTRVSSDYLVEGKDHYQGASILWRKGLIKQWSGIKDCLKTGGKMPGRPCRDDRDGQKRRIRNYIRAMDCVAKTKIDEMLPLFEGISPEGEMLDVGAGSGAVAAGFLEHFSGLRSTLVDGPEVLGHTEEFINERGISERVDFMPANILEPWPTEKRRFDIVMLSNIIHAYSEKELPNILAEAEACMKDDGVLIIHDFFPGHFPVKAALFDLNMFINTYNGRVFPVGDVRDELIRLKLYVTSLIPLRTDTALIVASRKEERLKLLNVDNKELLIARIRATGFRNVLTIPVDTVHIPGWTDMRCRYGCGNFGKPHCPPYAPSADKTKEFIRGYSLALLVEGEPPTREFQLRMLRAEKEAFETGFYKAFAYWAGPCSLCPSCAEDGGCRNTKDARPSMEGAGIDVFETVKRAGLSLRTLQDKGDYVKYFGLILLE